MLNKSKSLPPIKRKARLDRLGAKIFVLTLIGVLRTSRWENGNKNQKIIIRRRKALLFNLSDLQMNANRCTNRCQYTYIFIYYIIFELWFCPKVSASSLDIIAGSKRCNCSIGASSCNLTNTLFATVACYKNTLSCCFTAFVNICIAIAIKR